MDIAKYAGLFLIRMEYCYLPGLGNLEITRKQSAYSSELGSITPAKQRVTFRSTIGSIDDSFANFVATNERISIASASNAIKEFSSQVKQELKEGKEIEIPGIGHFYMQTGIVEFRPNPDLEINAKPIPVFKNSERIQQNEEPKIKEIHEATTLREPKADDEIELQAPTVNWGKVIIVGLIVLALLAGIGYAIYYVATHKGSATENAIERPIDVNPASVVPIPTTANTNPAASSGTNDGATDVYSIITNEYNSAGAAAARVKKLEGYSYTANTYTQDSITYFVTVNVNKAAGAPQTVVDSIKRMLNPNYNVRLK